MEERIRLENVHQQYYMTMEQCPESFGNIHMLYVPIELNNCPIKAFVDSGAQMTIMSLD